MIVKFFKNYREWRRLSNDRMVLRGLSDRQLKDMGISRGEIDCVTRKNRK